MSEPTRLRMELGRVVDCAGQPRTPDCRCETCLHWRRFVDVTWESQPPTVGFCRRNPPTYVKPTNSDGSDWAYAEWPVTGDGGVCGEWEAKL